MTGLNPPVANNWLTAYAPSYADFNTYIRDTFNFLASPPKLRATATITQAVPSNTWTQIELDTVTEDTYSGWQNSGSASNYYQAVVPGWYAVTWTVNATVPTGTVGRPGLGYRIDGNTVGPFDFCQAEAGGISPWGWDAYNEIYLEAGDGVYPWFLQLNASSQNTAAGSSLEIVWISE